MIAKPDERLGRSARVAASVLQRRRSARTRGAMSSTFGWTGVVRGMGGLPRVYAFIIKSPRDRRHPGSSDQEGHLRSSWLVNGLEGGSCGLRECERFGDALQISAVAVFQEHRRRCNALPAQGRILTRTSPGAS